jgi:serine/threonine protein kinase
LELLFLEKRLETTFSVECGTEVEMVAAETFVQAMKKRQYPYIVPYFSTFRDGKNVVIVMEDYEKGTLGMCLDYLAEKRLRLEEQVYIKLFLF